MYTISFRRVSSFHTSGNVVSKVCRLTVKLTLLLVAASIKESTNLYTGWSRWGILVLQPWSHWIFGFSIPQRLQSLGLGEEEIKVSSDFSRFNHRQWNHYTNLRLPCHDCIVLDNLASVFFAFLSFALLRFLDGILKGDTRRMYSNLQRFMIDVQFKANNNYSETLFINVLPLWYAVR